MTMKCEGEFLMTHINGIVVFGDPIENALEQMKIIAQSAEKTALMADHHLGYSMPIGGVAAYSNIVSPSGVGYDIACGNKAVRLDVPSEAIQDRLEDIMDRINSEVSFGVGRNNPEPVEDPLFDDDTWAIPAVSRLKDLARRQLGTVGGGNHYVDIFKDETGYVWVGVHFGSRGFGHKVATYYIQRGGGKNGVHAPPVLFEADSAMGREYLAAMHLAGRYAYAGRDFVCAGVAGIIGGTVIDEVHNHHNYTWKESHFGKEYYVVRKGATPAFPGQRGFVGGSMGESAVILRGRDSPESRAALYSTVHGAGRVMSRRQAAGKTRKKKGRKVQVAEGAVTRDMMLDWMKRSRVVLRGGSVDESPHCYKRLADVLEAHGDTIEIEHRLYPLGVAMAGSHIYDPYRD